MIVQKVERHPSGHIYLIREFYKTLPTGVTVFVSRRTEDVTEDIQWLADIARSSDDLL